MNYVIISDIHSNIETLEKYRDKLEHYAQSKQLVFAGDYIDGYHQETGAGVKVLQFIKDLEDAGAIVLLGNHDLNFLRALGYQTPKSMQKMNFEHWLQIGGEESLMSWATYFISSFKQRYQLLEALIDRHELYEFENFIHKYMGELVEWLNNHEYYHQDDKLFISHAGVDLTKSLQDQTIDDLIWTRHEMFDNSLTYEEAHPDWVDKVFVFGHTPAMYIRDAKNIQDDNPYSVYKPDGPIKMYDIDAGSHSGYRTSHLNLLEINSQGQVSNIEFLQA